MRLRRGRSGAGHPNVVLWASAWERTALLVGSGAHQKVVTQGSPQWSAVLLKRMDERVRQLTATGATVVMLTQAPFYDSGNPVGPTPSDEDFERLNALLTKFAAHTPHVRLVDLAARVCPSGPPCPFVVDDVAARSDGAHYNTTGALWVARWLMPQLGIAALDRPDTALPIMTIVKPTNGAVLKGKSRLWAVSSFNVGIGHSRFRNYGQFPAQRRHRQCRLLASVLEFVLEHLERSGRDVHSAQRRLQLGRRSQRKQGSNRARVELTRILSTY